MTDETNCQLRLSVSLLRSVKIIEDLETGMRLLTIFTVCVGTKVKGFPVFLCLT